MVKRSAEEQINENTDFDALEESGPSVGTWEKAPPEVLATRKIRKIKRPAGGASVVAGEVPPNKAADQSEESQDASTESNPLMVCRWWHNRKSASTTQSLPTITTNMDSQESAAC